MQTKVERILTRGNQIAIVGRPSQTGLQVLIVGTDEINPYSGDEDILLQLVTPDGDEIDRAYAPYIVDAQANDYGSSLKAIWSRFFR